MTIKYALDRKSLYDGKYSNSHKDIISGDETDKIKLKTHLAVIYRLIKYNRKKAKDEEKEKASQQS